MLYKYVKDSLGRVIACGPNKDSYQPVVPEGGTLEYSDEWQVAKHPAEWDAENP